MVDLKQFREAVEFRRDHWLVSEIRATRDGAAYAAKAYAEGAAECDRLLSIIDNAGKVASDPVVDDAMRELIEADEKYDEARRQVYDLSRTGAVQCRADLDLLDKAAARRAAALARVQVVQP